VGPTRIKPRKVITAVRLISTFSDLSITNCKLTMVTSDNMFQMLAQTNGIRNMIKMRTLKLHIKFYNPNVSSLPYAFCDTTREDEISLKILEQGYLKWLLTPPYFRGEAKGPC